MKSEQRLKAEVQRLTALEAAHQKRETVRRLLREFNFPDPDSNDPKDKTIVSEQFLELLLEAENEEAIRELIEERARLVRTLEGAEADQSLLESGSNCAIRPAVAQSAKMAGMAHSSRHWESRVRATRI